MSLSGASSHCNVLQRDIETSLLTLDLAGRERKTIICERMMIHPAVEEHIELVGDKDYLKATLGR